MEIKKTLTIDAAPEQVADILLSNELAEARMRSLGVTDFTHEVTGETAVTDARIGADRLPEVARRFVKSGLHVTVTGTRSGDTVSYSVDPHGLPGVVSFVDTIRSNGAGGTTVDVEGDLRIKIPLVGPKLERQAVAYVERLLRKEPARIAEVLG